MLISMLVLLLLGFATSSKTLKKLRATESVEAPKSVHLKVKKRLKSKTIVFFILVSNLLLLYLICFCHVAKTTMA